MTEVVTLLHGEMLIAAEAGLFRRSFHMKRGSTGRYGIDNTATGLYEADIVSCQCELAVAKFLNLYPHLVVADLTSPDVGFLVEVRSIIEPNRNLIVHDADKNHAPFVLVYPAGRVFTLIGWSFGREAKTEANAERGKRLLRDGGFVMLQSDLNPDFDQLRQFCADHLVAPQRQQEAS